MSNDEASDGLGRHHPVSDSAAGSEPAPVLQLSVTDAMSLIRSKLERRRWLNNDEWRRSLCVSPPPQSISLTFRETDALLKCLDVIQSADLLAQVEGLRQVTTREIYHDYVHNGSRTFGHNPSWVKVSDLQAVIEKVKQ